jgi:hypothetical protein
VYYIPDSKFDMVFAGLALLGALAFWYTKVSLTPTGIESRFFLLFQKTLPFASVQAIEVKNPSSTTIKARDGKKVEILSLYSGKEAFLAALHDRLPKLDA